MWVSFYYKISYIGVVFYCIWGGVLCFWIDVSFILEFVIRNFYNFGEFFNFLSFGFFYVEWGVLIWWFLCFLVIKMIVKFLYFSVCLFNVNLLFNFMDFVGVDLDVIRKGFKLV